MRAALGLVLRVVPRGVLGRGVGGGIAPPLCATLRVGLKAAKAGFDIAVAQTVQVVDQAIEVSAQGDIRPGIGADKVAFYAVSIGVNADRHIAQIFVSDLDILCSPRRARGDLCLRARSVAQSVGRPCHGLAPGEGGEIPTGCVGFGTGGRKHLFAHLCLRSVWRGRRKMRLCGGMDLRRSGQRRSIVRHRLGLMLGLMLGLRWDGLM